MLGVLQQIGWTFPFFVDNGQLIDFLLDKL